MRDPIRLNPIASMSERARAFFRSEVTLPAEFRLAKLDALERAMRANEEALMAALKADLGKPTQEAYTTELGIIYGEIAHTRKHLKAWMRPRPQAVSMAIFPAKGWQLPEPLGTALIIAPWNYPFQLLASPLVGAIAAGCNAVVKPSELAPETAKVSERILKQAFGDDGYVTVVQGGIDESQALLAERWDLVFFTGSTQVGQKVMEAAAKHLTPVVLELGGKSPTLVAADANLEGAAKRIIWAKCINAGQTCVAPDYVLVEKGAKAPLIEALKRAITAAFGADPKASPDFARIISPRHFQRLLGLMKGGTVVAGGQSDADTRYLAPTLLTDVDLAHPLMQEEIFGPLLPIIEVASLDEAVRFTRERPKPLALYVFTSDASKAEMVLRRAPSGGAMVNDCILHMVSPDLPFGGVGASGMGAYHGQSSFDVFSHLKSVVKKPWLLDLKFRYPPYTAPLALFRRVLG